MAQCPSPRPSIQFKDSPETILKLITDMPDWNRCVVLHSLLLVPAIEVACA